MLPWFINQFSFKYLPLVIVRHPFAVVASQLQHQGWDYSFQRFKIPNAPFNYFYEKHKRFLLSLNSKEEQLVALWCMTNNVVLRHSKNNNSWISINYENIVLDPMYYFSLIFDRWNLNMPEVLPDIISIPSSTTSNKKQIDPKQQITNWKNILTAQQICRLLHVLDYFEVDYYNEGVMPLIPAHKIQK